ncbi:MAG TPA: cysteine desulfurase family protein [Bacteroidota bacterium]|jgi:cysteine desulfurase|nr:cysteine desulfurase family protein [Bacteroidota bacterium]
MDHTATTPLDPAVFEAMRPYFDVKFGNASSVHRFGQEARAALDSSRDAIARAVGAKAGEIFFVSGGTESDNFAIKGIAGAMRRSGKNHIVTSKTEHHAVLETCQFLSSYGFEISYVDVNPQGVVLPETVRAAMKPTTGLVSIMYVNNEIGTINPIREIGRVVKVLGIPFHTDAVQAFGKIDINVEELGVDLLSISAHKIYGPKGVGALYIRKGLEIDNVIHGGGQERGRRAGTENVPLVVGFAEGARRMIQDREQEWMRLYGLKRQLGDGIKSRFSSAVFNGDPENGLPHILNVSFDSKKIEIDGEALLYRLDLNGIAATSGSACTSGSMDPSHVLLALGRDPGTAKATIRFSMGRSTTKDDIDYTLETLETIVSSIGRKLE